MTAQNGNVTVNGFDGQLRGVPLPHNGTWLLNNNFQIRLNQNAVNQNVPAVVNAGAHIDFEVTLTGEQNFPNEIGAAELALTLIARTDAGDVTDTVNSAGSVYLTFGVPGGAVQSPVSNCFTLGGNPQHVTPARLALAILAVRLGRNAIPADGGVPKTTRGVPRFAFDEATDCVDAIFLFLKSRGIEFSLGYRWDPTINTTGLEALPTLQKPPLHTYLWMSLSPAAPGIPARGVLPRTEAWAECHNLAAAFALMGEILGLAPFVVNYGAGNQFGYALDYPQSRRQDIAPFDPRNVQRHGLLEQPYRRVVVEPNGRRRPQSLCFVDPHGGVNNFEGVTVFDNVRLYPLGECILAAGDRDENADNYYCQYLQDPDYVPPHPPNPQTFNTDNGLAPLVFAEDWRWFWYFGGYWYPQSDFDPAPYGVRLAPLPLANGMTPPGCFYWQN